MALKLMAVLAHPDDESIQTGGTLAKAAQDGHRTVLVFGTRGEHGEVDDGFLDRAGGCGDYWRAGGTVDLEPVV